MNLTTDQEQAKQTFIQFILDPHATTMVLMGHSGTGKSELVKHLLGEIPNILDTLSLISTNPIDYTPVLSATTNKAADVLKEKTGHYAQTVHTLLGIAIQKVGFNTTYTLTKENRRITNSILFVDESSFIDQELYEIMLKRISVSSCKVVFIGDPSQLAPVGEKDPYLFSARFKPCYTATLNQVVRQQNGSALEALGESLRLSVVNKTFPKLMVANPDILYYADKADFLAAAEAEFTRPDWGNNDSKVLSWTNKTAISYNEFIKAKVVGTSEIRPGDILAQNSFVHLNDSRIRPDTEVMVESIEPTSIDVGKEYEYSVAGYWVNLSRYKQTFFMPLNNEVREKALDYLRKNSTPYDYHKASDEWLDLRPIYASTINKSQGSTYKKAFIDLSDFKRCKHNVENLSRLLYVGCTRPSEQLILTGDV